ncbi:MAG TPA: ATP-binding protein [Burkholderiaceae bacterium]|nr:ATP-binding protein [Burkholderiaceae bacterium]
MTAADDPADTAATPLMGGLQRRLLLLLLFPFGMLVLVGTWLHYQSAGSAALQQDLLLAKLAPMLGDSVVAAASDAPDATPAGRRGRSAAAGGETAADRANRAAEQALALPRPVLLLAPPVVEFLTQTAGATGYSISSIDGQQLLGDAWLPPMMPVTREPEFISLTQGGVTYRVIAQRVYTAAGELIVQLADGSDARQQWAGTVLSSVLLPNLVLMAVAAVWVRWAVRRALRPLMELKTAVEQRSPRDLSPLAVQATPTEVQPLVQSLNRLFAMVNAQAEAQRRFVADAAHQLRTPIAGLQAQVEAWGQAARHIEKGGAMRLPVEQVMRLRHACRRTSQLANQLLALSRADATTAASQAMQRVDLRALCEAVLAQHLDEALARHIDLGLDAQPAQTDGHEWLLRELLINLVDNALRYTPAHSSVTVRCGVKDGQPFLAVEDNGPGIEPAERARVLQRFYRVPGTQAEGNGLGLAIADEIARAHATQLQLEPASGGQGLRVSVLFKRG